MGEHVLASVSGIAWEMGLRPGDVLLSINGQEIKDLLDYQWLASEEELLVIARKPSGEIWELEIEKDALEDLGLGFLPGSMGEDRVCGNACIFCFVDQQPPGLRDSLYVKDDDPFQSFAAGNYVTLTNLSDEDIGQIIKHRLSPMRISVHTADMELRQEMMGTRKAGGLLQIIEKFSDNRIEMHLQVVLCKGVNDGAQLDNTLTVLAEFSMWINSIAVVPVGLTRYRDGLYPLVGFTVEDAMAVILQLDKWQAWFYKEFGRRIVFASDEWYILAGQELPRYENYDDFPQLDNGVGMLRLFENQWMEQMAELVSSKAASPTKAQPLRIGIVTGVAAGEFMKQLAQGFIKVFPDIAVDIHVVQNEFYGEGVTVSGLLTGRDIITQLTGRVSGLDVLFLPENAFRAGTDDMICGATLDDVSQALEVGVVKGSSDGGSFLLQLLRAR